MTVKKHISIRILESLGFSFSCLITLLLGVFLFLTFLHKIGFLRPDISGAFYYIFTPYFFRLTPYVLAFDLILGSIYFLFISSKTNILTNSMFIMGVFSLVIIALSAGNLVALKIR